MSAKEYREAVFGCDVVRRPRVKRARAFHYVDGWKPGGTRYEIERWAEWCGWYPRERRRYEDHLRLPAAAPLAPQLVDGRIAYRLAENECKLLRAACRQLRAKIRSASRTTDGNGPMARASEALEIIRFNLRIAEWAREWLAGRVDAEALRQRFETVRDRKGFPGVDTGYARKLLYVKIIQFAF